MSRKALLTLSASVMFGAAVAAPNAALAQFGPPPGPLPALAGPPPGIAGPAPGLGAGGPPAGAIANLPARGPGGAPPRDLAGGPSRLGGAGGLRGLDRGGQADFRGVEGRAAAYGANSYTRNSYPGYGHGYGHGYRYWPYAAAAAYAYGSSYASSGDGCYHASRRVLFCRGGD